MKMFDQGKAVEEIAKGTGLTEAQIKELVEEFESE